LNSGRYALYGGIVPIIARRKPKHVVAWVREQLDLTQSQLATLIGSSQHTIQAIESGRLPLSERFAYALSEKTGIRAKWLLANKLSKPLPDPVLMRAKFEDAKQGAWKGIYLAHLLPRMILLRIFVLLRAIVDELGYGGCRATGFNDTLQKMSLDLLDCVPDKRLRRRIYKAARDVVSKGDEQVLSLLLSDVQEMQRALREKKRRAGSEKTTLLPPTDEVSSPAP
jgi:transcriptional regulator with XRE-family HTH domain